MCSVREVQVTQHIAAPREQVWETLTHHESLPNWTPLSTVTMDALGSPHPNGVGAIRRMVAPMVTIVEEVVAWRPMDSFEYELREGVPIRDHRGTVTLADAGGGTEVTWHVQFRGAFPGAGWLVSKILGVALKDLLKRAKRQVEGG